MDKITAILCYLHDHHMGEEKAILSRNLERCFALDGRSLRRKISALREDGYPICSGPNGYYFAANDEEYIRYLCWHNRVVTPHHTPFSEDEFYEDEEAFFDGFEDSPANPVPVINITFCFGCCQEE